VWTALTLRAWKCHFAFDGRPSFSAPEPTLT
jgi:hypothetical protein